MDAQRNLRGFGIVTILKQFLSYFFMIPKLAQLSPISKSVLHAIEERWQQALPFFRKRGHVLFLSDRYRFWDTFGFVQQSLAKTLVDHGVRVTWLDGMNWRRYRPQVALASPLLEVKQLQCPPGRRLKPIDALSVRWQSQQIKKMCLDSKPLVWVQGSLDERVVERCENIDVFSVFDDAYLHQPGEALTEKVKLILNQNTFSDDLFQTSYPEKSLVALPPVELHDHVFHADSPWNLVPSNFPKKIMGYLGAFFPEGFDFTLLKKFVTQMPDWGFVFVGRTNPDGLAAIRELQAHSNFFYRDWMPREKLSSLWKLLDVNLMLYRDCRANSGAFPVKILEAMYFGVPSVATQVPKTSSLEGVIPMSNSFQELSHLAKAEAILRKDQSTLFESLYYEMHPKVHLARVAERLTLG